MEADLGIAPADHGDGRLQDVHWYGVSTVGGGFRGTAVTRLALAGTTEAEIATPLTYIAIGARLCCGASHSSARQQNL
jgi:hypothetical protein